MDLSPLVSRSSTLRTVKIIIPSSTLFMVCSWETCGLALAFWSSLYLCTIRDRIGRDGSLERFMFNIYNKCISVVIIFHCISWSKMEMRMTERLLEEEDDDDEEEDDDG